MVPRNSSVSSVRWAEAGDPLCPEKSPGWATGADQPGRPFPAILDPLDPVQQLGLCLTLASRRGCRRALRRAACELGCRILSVVRARIRV
jgi:hypothetical protein